MFAGTFVNVGGPDAFFVTVTVKDPLTAFSWPSSAVQVTVVGTELTRKNEPGSLLQVT